LEELLQELESKELMFENYKVEYIRLESGNILYSERLILIKKIAEKITGKFSLTKPEIVLGITFYENEWIFGINNKNNFLWNSHHTKPYSYSNSFGVKLAKTLVNIATFGDSNSKIIDPCCGIGTTIVEGLSMNYNISGQEINSLIAENANKNLIHYNLPPIVLNKDMHLITNFYDTSIIDLPYGIFSHTSLTEQKKMIETGKKISSKMILITFEPLEKIIEECDFKIIDFCTLKKGNFKRHIYICE
jgi:tRNA G10  N-methylase Trm11